MQNTVIDPPGAGGGDLDLGTIRGARSLLSKEELDHLLSEVAIEEQGKAFRRQKIATDPGEQFNHFIDVTLRERNLFHQTLLVAYGRAIETGQADFAKYLELVLGIKRPVRRPPETSQIPAVLLTKAIAFARVRLQPVDQAGMEAILSGGNW